MSGTVADASGEPLIGANVVAVHLPSGTTYGTSTDIDGTFNIANMRVGGPYKITTSYTGYGDNVIEGIVLKLGEAQRRNIVLEEQAIELSGVQVVATRGATGQNAGASTQITSEELDALPTLNRDLNDFTRLTPQASTSVSGISFAGVNNRYNAIYIDGAVNNDVFGLASSGTNGGQTGISPISVDVIDQIQVVLSPYDVTLGGFAGGGINAVTKSGTNTFSGTAYYFVKNQDLAGKTPGKLIDRVGGERTKLDQFTEKLYGASLGGPIVKDKVFFFANVEIQRDETPAPFDFGTYRG
ncbi:MAG: carboxypeptidase regulatory-like domain-containing protein, partial [Saprospiraceae bacterium]|nr:carboxypeptidase regulatory-like domain-containing protein [Saprospiraceae bacterium]